MTIEEIKKEFEEKFISLYPSCDCDADFECKDEVFNFFLPHLQPDIDANEEWYPVTREWFLEKMESYFSHQKNEEKI